MFNSNQRKSLKRLKETVSVYQKNQIQLNRLYSQKAASQQKITMISKNNRKARTRTLIQIGGLVVHSGLIDFLGIQMGEDLQKDPGSIDKSATLLGMFLQMVESFQGVLDPKAQDSLKIRGLSSLRSKEENQTLTLPPQSVTA